MIYTDSISSNVFVRLNRTEGIEHLANHHCQAGWDSQKQVHCAAWLKVIAGLPQPFHDHARNIGSLARRRYS
jgi:hypothetical protein